MYLPSSRKSTFWFKGAEINWREFLNKSFIEKNHIQNLKIQETFAKSPIFFSRWWIGLVYGSRFFLMNKNCKRRNHESWQLTFLLFCMFLKRYYIYFPYIFIDNILLELIILVWLTVWDFGGPNFQIIFILLNNQLINFLILKSGIFSECKTLLNDAIDFLWWFFCS